MYVCVCNAVTDRDIGQAVANGCGSLRELREELGVGACCGRCNGCARNLLRASLPAHPHRSQHSQHSHQRPTAAVEFAAA